MNPGSTLKIGGWQMRTGKGMWVARKGDHRPNCPHVRAPASSKSGSKPHAGLSDLLPLGCLNPSGMLGLSGTWAQQTGGFYPCRLRRHKSGQPSQSPSPIFMLEILAHQPSRTRENRLFSCRDTERGPGAVLVVWQDLTQTLKDRS